MTCYRSECPAGSVRTRARFHVVHRNMAFDQATADLICERLAGGESLRAVCRDLRSPSITEVMRWLGNEANANFREQYARAFQLRADAKFEELDDVSDEAVNAETAVQVQGLRLKADNIKWQLARMNAKKYGDKITAEHTGADGGPIQTESTVHLTAEEAYKRMLGGV